MKMLNIACGARYHADWVNIDFHADSDLVKGVNILSGLPFDDGSIDVIYCSHFLEHLSPSQVDFVLNEINRVTKLGGIIRIVVPDLENICREYLSVLGEVEVASHKVNKRKYEWIVTELIDQLVRVESGGQMSNIFNEVVTLNDADLAGYILSRVGDELLSNKPKVKREVTFDKFKNKILYFYLSFIRLLVPSNLRDLIFVRTSIGERHQWMYDRYSMMNLLKIRGFKEVHVEQFDTGGIADFNSYMLDIKPDGTAYKGESSLYIEAVK